MNTHADQERAHNHRHARVFAIVVATLLLLAPSWGCGGADGDGGLGTGGLEAGGGGGSGGGGGFDAGVPISVNTLSSIVGTYTLADFTVRGSACGGTVTPSDPRITSWSGTMTITPGGQWTQTISINGQSVTVSQLVDVVGTNLIRTTAAGGCSYTASFGFTSTARLTTTATQGTCGIPCSETDVWQRVSTRAKPGLALQAPDDAATAGAVVQHVFGR